MKHSGSSRPRGREGAHADEQQEVFFSRSWATRILSGHACVCVGVFEWMVVNENAELGKIGDMKQLGTAGSYRGAYMSPTVEISTSSLSSSFSPLFVAMVGLPFVVVSFPLNCFTFGFQAVNFLSRCRLHTVSPVRSGARDKSSSTVAWIARAAMTAW